MLHAKGVTQMEDAGGGRRRQMTPGSEALDPSVRHAQGSFQDSGSVSLTAALGICSGKSGLGGTQGQFRRSGLPS